MLAHPPRQLAALEFVLQHLQNSPARPRKSKHWPAFALRLDREFGNLFNLFQDVYGHRDDFLAQLAALIEQSFRSWKSRPKEMKALDLKHESDPHWFQSRKMLGGVCYVDLYAGNLNKIRAQIPYFKELGLTYLHLMPLFKAPEINSDGGYAVSSYREVNPSLGTMAQLRRLATELRQNGISLVIDFIFNHTSNEHDWAKAALAGDKSFEDYYWIFPNREMPDAYERDTREIFPDDHPGSFVQLPDGRWIWATFYHFQWDLNYSNPAVFRAMAGEMLFLANQGVDFLRMDAVAFIWKQLGTTCESLPQAHTLIRAFNAVCRIAAPSLLFKSEAIVHPDEVVTYIDPKECQVAYNPLLMALGWEALATRDVRLLALALERRQNINPDCAWVNYVRSHDDIGWTFADEEAAELGINGYDHRRFLNNFYVNRFEGSFARGVPFQDNPKTGDCRIAGTAASLCGIESGDSGGVDRLILLYAIALSAGGIPLIYLGDEVGQLNDYAFAKDPAKAGDSRWVNRPPRPSALFKTRTDTDTVHGQIFTRLTRLIEIRKAAPEFDGGKVATVSTGNTHVLGYLRAAKQSRLLCLANFDDDPQTLTAEIFAQIAATGKDLITNTDLDLTLGVRLQAHQTLWLRLK